MNLHFPGFLGSPEEHKFRSKFMQWLLHQQQPVAVTEKYNLNPIPKILIQYWHNLRELPYDVQKCIESWKPLEYYGFKRIIFDDGRARSFIEKYFSAKHVSAFDLCYHPAMRSDYFRLCYIFKSGGFYIDTDEVYQGIECEDVFIDGRLKIQPLCYDTATNLMVNPEIFLGDLTYPSSRIFYVNNNPIIGPAGHEILRLAIERSTQILLNSTDGLEIQETTGPGNLSASLVKHAISSKLQNKEWDFLILPNWESISVCEWFLSYRNDERNWRFLNNRRH